MGAAGDDVPGATDPGGTDPGWGEPWTADPADGPAADVGAALLSGSGDSSAHAPIHGPIATSNATATTVRL